MWFSALLQVLLIGESLLPPIEEVKLTGPYVRTYTGNFVVSACEEFTGGGAVGLAAVRLGTLMSACAHSQPQRSAFSVPVTRVMVFLL